ncbi:MAG TPA: penicillin acylase family protein [Longimicrobiales bacterium]|nr:penicillin acylase family protein [Longimicrobiales bacterium]
MSNRTARRTAVTLAALALAACAHAPTPASAPPAATVLPDLARQVEIRRTEHGVAHVLAENLRAAGFALAYVQLEDHGSGIIRGMEAARGRLALVEGLSRVEMDARAKLRHALAAESFALLRQDTRDVYTGFAEGMNHYIRTYRDDLPEWVRPDFTGIDVLARDVGPGEQASAGVQRRLAALPGGLPLLVRDESGTWRHVGGAVSADTAGRGEPVWDEGDGYAAYYGAMDELQNVGSNAWALAPGRTSSGHAILLRNPHLVWTAGYYEAHLRVPGKLDFYGDFRIGGPFTVIGGFNRSLGFATTNNASRSHELYALRLDPAQANHVLLDGGSVPLERVAVDVEYRDGAGVATATREFWTSPLGPVVHRGDSIAYIYRAAAADAFEAGEQWLAMMQANDLEEWKDAMRMGARTTSNFTYADRDGNIFYVWMSGAPVLPHPAGGDSVAVLVTRTADAWQRTAPFDSLPQLHNPPGGYVRNENDSPHFTNLNRILPDSYSFFVEAPRLRLRSQHAVQLLHNDRVFSLEDVVVTKHSARMFLADRVKEDLIRAVRGTAPGRDAADAVALLEAWDNTVSADSRGGVLFETWWNRYRDLMDGQDLHAVEWTADEPATTPRGLADPDRAAEAFAWAIPETARRFGAWDAAWGDVHRVRRGAVDVPVSGCAGILGCYRVLAFEQADDGRRVVNGGDGWVIAVEFGDPPRAYSVLAYGQSPDPTSPYHATQAEMFAAGRMKAVHWTEDDIARATVRRYRPGEERR